MACGHLCDPWQESSHSDRRSIARRWKFTAQTTESATHRATLTTSVAARTDTWPRRSQEAQRYAGSLICHTHRRWGNSLTFSAHNP